MDQGVTAESVSGSLGEKNARDEDVQVLSQEEAEREMRRKRRRRLYRLLNQRDTPPSFLAVLQVDPHRQKDGKDVIVIDEGAAVMVCATANATVLPARFAVNSTVDCFTICTGSGRDLNAFV